MNLFEENHPCILDSGSEASIIKHDIGLELIRKYQLKLKKSFKRLRGISGAELDVTGAIDIPFVFNKYICYHQVILVRGNSFNGNLLLGRDFMRKFSVSLNFRHRAQSHAIVKGYKYSFTGLTSPSKVCYIKPDEFDSHVSIVKAPKDFLIKSNTALNYFGKVPSHLNGKTVIFEPNCNRVIFPRIVCNVNNGKIPITAINVTDKDVQINLNKMLGKVYLIDEEINRNSEVPLERSKKTSDRNNDIENIENDDNAVLHVGCGRASDRMSSLDKDFIKLVDSVDLDHLEGRDRDRIRALIRQNRTAISVNNEVGHVKCHKHKIIISPDVIPINTPQYRIPYHARSEINKHVDNMIEQEIIEPCSSPWNSPVLLVKKPNNAGYRFCIDYRKLNTVIQKDVFPIPLITEILEDLNGSSVFTTLDMKHGYFNIELDENSRNYTAFRTNRGSYRFRRSPQGLSTSSSAYQRVCNLIFSKQLGRFMFAYIDDLIIYSKNMDEHVDHLKEVFRTISESGFKLGLEKCQFAKPSVRYLGHVISEKGIQVDPTKTKAISNMPVPRSVKHVRRFLGCCSYYRKFIKNFAKISSPLTQLTKKNQRFKWTKESQESFDTLKSKLTSPPILSFPDYTRRFQLHCDASSINVGGVLSQKFDDGERPIGYFSRKLKGAELNYSVTELEALAIHESVKFFSAYLWGTSFDIYTDHKALQYIFKHKLSVPRIARWAIFLADYNYNIFYKDGKSHVVPDFLSRNDYEDEDTDTIAYIQEIKDAFDEENLRTEQMNDPIWSRVIRYLEGEDINIKKINYIEDYFVENGILYRMANSGKRARHDKIQIVVPRKLIKQALILSHDSEIACHMGILRTLERCKDNFYWLNMIKDVRKYVSSCLECQKRKWQGQEIAPLGEFKPVAMPLERLGIDLIEMPSSYNRNKYILTIIDHFTRYVSAYPLVDKSTETVTKAMVQFITLNGVPISITSDRGSEFQSNLFQNVCRNLEVKCNYTTAYHPSSNGACEKANSTIKKLLSHLSSDDKFTWDEQLPFALLAMNTAYQSLIQEVPYFLHHGRDANLPFNKLVNKRNRVNYSDDYASEMSGRLSKAFALVKTLTQKAHDLSAKQYNKRVRNTNKVEIGSIVLLRNETNKTQSVNGWPTRYIGPYRVVDKYNNNFKIKGIYSDKRVQTVHLNRIKIATLRDNVAYPFNNDAEELGEHNVSLGDEPPLENVNPSNDEESANVARDNRLREAECTIAPRYNLRNRK